MKKYELHIDPRILELLGPSLYTNIYYVLAELIANAYDADTKNVYIISKENSIIVEDDGHGMSYKDGEISKYLNVAKVSRTEEDNSFTKSKKRRKMGRKGVGKLAALSVSEYVDIVTISNGEKSGFVLARNPQNGNELQPINDDKIKFEYVQQGSGTSIIMKNPQYTLHKTLGAVKRNLLKIFPLIDSDFKIHIIRDKERETIDSFDKSIMNELCALITLGEEYENLKDLVPDVFPTKRDSLIDSRDSYSTPLCMKNINDEEKEYNLKIKGWIGAYKTTRGRKAEMTDFPDNFISLVANNKMGEFNILPTVGQNKLNEVYIIGQLHVDLFELSELPDMALSNRQGYKSDDLRYETVRDYVRDTLLPDILNKRKLFADLRKEKKKKKVLEDMKDDEKKLKNLINNFRTKTSDTAAKSIAKLGVNANKDLIEKTINDSINDNLPKLDIKSSIDSRKKRILISQTYDDKQLADIIFSLLLYNNVPPRDILYTNCDDEICRIPEGVSVYKYLREFFVESYSTQKIYVLFVTSENTKKSWGAIIEIGASWITQIDHNIFNILPFKPEHPLNNEQKWHDTGRDTGKSNDLFMSELNSDIFCQKIEAVCDYLKYDKKSRIDNKNYLEKLIAIKP